MKNVSHFISSLKKAALLCAIIFAFAVNSHAQIWVNPLTTGRPIASYYLGDKLSANWYFNFEIGQTNWHESDVGIGQDPDGSTGWDWAEATWYQDNGATNRYVHSNIGNFQFTAAGTWYVVGRARANFGDAWTYGDQGGWSNETTLTASTSAGSCPYFTVSDLSDPSALTATPASSAQINLTWTKWNSKNVMVVRTLTSAFPPNDPAQGTSYSVGANLGSGTVVYNGSGTSFDNTGLTPGTDYSYTFYSENYSYYSAGSTTSATTSSVSATTDYFQSKASGNWSEAATWESSADNVAWIDATLAPTSSAASITVSNLHTVTLDAAASAKVLTIASTGVLSCGTYTLTVATAGSLTNTGTFTAGTGTVAFAGTGTISGTVAFYDVTLAGGVNFGTGSTVNGTLSINTGGFVNTNAPAYGSTSTLKYNSGSTYGRGTEWSATSGSGYPYHVQISNSTILDMGANSGTAAARQCAGSLTIDAGSTFSMNVSAMTAAVTVVGNISNYGTVTLSGSIGGDLITTGSLLDNSAFNANNRAVFFNGGATQEISGTGTFDISYIRINKTGGSVKLLSNLVCAGPNGGNAMEIDGTSSVLDLNGFTLTLGGASSNSTYNSGVTTPGVIRGSSASSISVLGTGALGTIMFDQTTPGTTNLLQSFTINRTGSGSVTLGNNLDISGLLIFQDGILTTGSNTATIGASGTISNASSTKYVNGKLALTFGATGAKEFPIGKSGNYRPITFEYTALTGTSTVTAEQVEAGLTGTLPTNTTLLTTDRYWTISQAGGSNFGYKVTLDASGYTPTTTVTMLKKDATIVSYAAALSFSTLYTNTTALTSFSDFALGQVCTASAGTSPKVSDLVITPEAGATFKWYTSGGVLIADPANTDLVNGNHYFASQTVNGLESTLRREVVANVNDCFISVTTDAASAVTSTTATCGGTLSNNCGSSVSARGVCWSTSAGPKVTGSHTSDGTDLGTFTSSITGLTTGTKYYVRAYATSTSGTAYGNEIDFTTP
jgi:hypothetical protein